MGCVLVVCRYVPQLEATVEEPCLLLAGLGDARCLCQDFSLLLFSLFQNKYYDLT